MSGLKTALALAVVAGVVSVAAADAASPSAPSRSPAPIARASGSDAGPAVYPSVVNVRLVRTQADLAAATAALESGDSATAIKALTNVRSNMRKAWLGAKYVIANAPPPVAGDGRARAAGAPVAGASPYADQFTTTGGVLSLQHQVAVTALGMIDNAGGTLFAAVNSTVFAALNARDASVEYIHALPVPPAAEGRAHKSDAVAPTWDVTMQAVLPDLDDELAFADAAPSLANLSSSAKKLVGEVELQDTKTEKTINKYWPPLPAAG